MNNSYGNDLFSRSGSSMNEILTEVGNGLSLHGDDSIHFPKLFQPLNALCKASLLEPMSIIKCNKDLYSLNNYQTNIIQQNQKKLTLKIDCVGALEDKTGNFERNVVFVGENDKDLKENVKNIGLETASNYPVHKKDHEMLERQSFMGDMSGLDSEMLYRFSNLTGLLKQNDYGNLKSPDLFDDDDDDATGNGDNNDEEINSAVVVPNDSSISSDQSKEKTPTKLAYEKEILRKTRNCLSGVLPPPSVTILQMDLFEEVLSRKSAILSYLNDLTDTSDCQTRKLNSQHSATLSTLWKPTHSLEAIKTLPWNEVFHAMHHGLCYNVTKDSETIEYLNLSVIERFIGAETASSHRNFVLSPMSPVLRPRRLQSKSPGNRLSHLAKRRAIFSSATLAVASQKSTALIGRQIVLDQRKGKNRRKILTPKRLISDNGQDPICSTENQLLQHKAAQPGVSRETSKRALFQSPEKNSNIQSCRSASSLIPMPELSSRVERSKRVLMFSPERLLPTLLQQQNKQEPIYFENNKCNSTDTSWKRKREPGELTKTSNSKLQKTSHTVTSRTLMVKSQSFCIGTDATSMRGYSSISENLKTSYENSLGLSVLPQNGTTEEKTSKKIFQKSRSETAAAAYSLTENQKKKLLWAVSQALQEKKINTKHEKFKEYAATLAKVVRRLFQEYYQKHSVSNSETMLKLARQYVYYVTTNMSVDDIYNQAVEKLLKAKEASHKPTGYIGPSEFNEMQKSKAHLMQFATNMCKKIPDKIGNGSCAGGVGKSTSAARLVYQELSDDSGREKMPEDHNRDEEAEGNRMKNDLTSSGLKKPSSSSKSNVNGSVLRENVDSELRRSAQKATSIKKDHHKSPYFGLDSHPSNVKTPGRGVPDLNMSMASRVKRHIIFDG